MVLPVYQEKDVKIKVVYMIYPILISNKIQTPIINHQRFTLTLHKKIQKWWDTTKIELLEQIVFILRNSHLVNSRIVRLIDIFLPSGKADSAASSVLPRDCGKELQLHPWRLEATALSTFANVRVLLSIPWV